MDSGSGKGMVGQGTGGGLEDGGWEVMVEERR